MTYTLQIVAAWAILYVIFCGVGLGVARWLACRVDSGRDILRCFWIGLAGVLAFLHVVHFWTPIHGWVRWCIVGAGVMGWGVQRHGVMTWLKTRRCHGAGYIYILGAMAVFALWLARQSAAQPENYDTGLYHASAIRWCLEFPLVPGLAHLHCRLGYNNSSTLYAALLNAGPFVGRYHHLATGLMVIALALQAVVGWRAAFRGDAVARPVVLLDALVLPFLVVWSIEGDQINSPSPEGILMTCGFFAGSELLHGILMPPGQPPAARRWNMVALVAALVCLIVVKVSMVVFALACVAVLVAWQVRLRLPWRWQAQEAARCAILAGLILVPWLIRGVVLSGYPLFPAKALAAPVDWRVAEAETDAYRWDIISYARTQGVAGRELAASTAWIRPWVCRVARIHRWDVMVPIAVGILALAAMVAEKRRPRRLGFAAWSMIPPVAAVVFMLCTAPSPRFVGAAFWLLGLIPSALWLADRERRTQIAVMAAGAVLVMARDVDLVEAFVPWKYDTRPIRSGPVIERVTDQGVRVWVPVDGDQCWDAPLPCTPYFNPGLELRAAGRLRSGFRQAAPAMEAPVP